MPPSWLLPSIQTGLPSSTCTVIGQRTAHIPQMLYLVSFIVSFLNLDTAPQPAEILIGSPHPL
jgi:hypothetical protein